MAQTSQGSCPGPRLIGLTGCHSDLDPASCRLQAGGLPSAGGGTVTWNTPDHTPQPWPLPRYREP